MNPLPLIFVSCFCLTTFTAQVTPIIVRVTRRYMAKAALYSTSSSGAIPKKDAMYPANPVLRLAASDFSKDFAFFHNIKTDGFVNPPRWTALRFILRFFKVRKVRINTQSYRYIPSSSDLFSPIVSTPCQSPDTPFSKHFADRLRYCFVVRSSGSTVRISVKHSTASANSLLK